MNENNRFCASCGAKMEDSALFCSSCGAKSDTNVNNGNNAYVPNNTYAPVNAYANSNNTYVNNNAYASPVNPNDKVSHGLNFLSWLIPLFGIIYYCIHKKEMPKKTKSMLVTSIVSIFVSPIICGILVAIAVPLYGAMTKDRLDEVDDYLMDNMPSDIDDDDLFHHDKKDENSNNSLVWTEYKININGKTVQLPCDYSEFVSITGMKMQDYAANSDLESRTCCYVTVYGEDTELSIELFNFDYEKAINMEDAVVGGVHIAYYCNEEDDIEVYPGVKLGMTKAQVKELLGEPDYNLDYDEGGCTCRYYASNESGEDLSMDFDENKKCKNIRICAIEDERSIFN